MEDINKILDEFFNTWKDDTNSRYLSWEHCYKFFKSNKIKILKDENLLDLASLNLAFYLASWGMYRGSSNLLWNDYKIHKTLIKNLLEKCDNLYKTNVQFDDIKPAYDEIKKYYGEHNITPTDTLITKVLMGIFGCVPAYDNFFFFFLSKHKITQRFNKSSYKKLQNLSDKIYKKNFPNNYPPMRLIDAYFGG